MSELPWSKFFWSDWEADQGLRLCSLAAQGLWMRMLCVCAKGDPRGFLAINGQPLDSTGVARLCGISEDEAVILMEELHLNGVFSRDRRGWIYSRRMVRDAKKSATGKKFANKRWSQTNDNKPEKPPPNGAPIGVPTTQKPEARSQKVNEEPIGSLRAERAERERAFEDFWNTYPHRNGAKKGRQAARKKWDRAIKSGTDPSEITSAAQAFHGDRQVVEGFAPDPATWLNQERWNDEIEPTKGTADGRDPDLERRMAEVRRALDERERTTH